MNYRWVIALTSAAALVGSISPLFYNTMPVFLKAISAETGWGRAQVISGISVCTGVRSCPRP